MKKVVVILLGVLIISNVVWSYVFFSNANEPSDTSIQVYNLNGDGDLWGMTNYQVIVSPSKILRGNGTLVFKGDPKTIENSTYYGYDFKEMNSSGEHEVVYSNIASSQGVSLSILKNLNIGSIIGEYAYAELEKDKHNYENTMVTITWNDNEGQLYSETINLDITSEVILNEEDE